MFKQRRTPIRYCTSFSPPFLSHPELLPLSQQTSMHL